MWRVRKSLESVLHFHPSATIMFHYLSGDALKRDDAWVDAEDKKAVHKLERLENELNNHKTSLVKESIRMGHNDLGDFHSERGDFAAALKCYVRTRDYCTTSKHIITMCTPSTHPPPPTHNTGTTRQRFRPRRL